MGSKPVNILTACVVSSVMLVGILYILSDDTVNKQNEFTRTFRVRAINEDAVLNLKYDSYYIAGATKDKIYFGNVVAPLHMVISNLNLTDTLHIQLNIENPENRRFKATQVVVDSPYFYVKDGTQPVLFRGRLNDWRAKRFMYDSAYFSLATPIGPASFVIRSLSANREDVLGKETYDQVSFMPGLLEKQIDGIFCVDGMLHYNKESARIVYLYYYRNQYIVMDSNLSVLYRGNTIDTISRTQIRTDSYESGGVQTYTMSTPPLLVNKKSSVYRNWLFVNSNLRAKNEKEELYDQTSVIDVYGLNSGTYEFSFYVHDFRKNKLKAFWVFREKLYALFGHYVVGYDLTNILIENQESLIKNIPGAWSGSDWYCLVNSRLGRPKQEKVENLKRE